MHESSLFLAALSFTSLLLVACPGAGPYSTPSPSLPSSNSSTVTKTPTIPPGPLPPGPTPAPAPGPAPTPTTTPAVSCAGDTDTCACELSATAAPGGECKPKTSGQRCCASGTWPSAGSCDCGESALAAPTCVKTKTGCACVKDFTPDGAGVGECKKVYSQERCCQSANRCYCDTESSACEAGETPVTSCESFAGDVCATGTVEVASCSPYAAAPPPPPPPSDPVVDACDGKPSACSSWTSTTCASHEGCSVEQACAGTALACSYLTTAESCQAQQGCSPGTSYCSGYATSCGVYSPGTECSRQPGCYTGTDWYCDGYGCIDYQTCKGSRQCSWKQNGTDCEAVDGCNWKTPCEGTATTCAGVRPLFCAQQRGCSLGTTGTCVGEPSACAERSDASSCGAETGCAWGERVLREGVAN